MCRRCTWFSAMMVCMLIHGTYGSSSALQPNSIRSNVVNVQGISGIDLIALKQRNTKMHLKTVEECLQEFAVPEGQGLSWSDAQERLAVVGTNALPEPKKKSTFKLVLEQFDDRLVQVLLVVAAVSAVLAKFEASSHAFAEPLAILAILILNALVGAYQTLSAEDSLSALKKLQPQTATVLRENVWVNDFPVSDIVPGDIVYVKVGGRIPADCRVISLKTTSFSTDESSLTGESMSSQKFPMFIEGESDDNSISSKSNMIFSGTMVASGVCIAMAVNTGMNTEMGMIDVSLQASRDDEQKTPLAKKLDTFGSQLSVVIAVICASVWVFSIPKFSSPVFASPVQGAVFYAKVAVALAVAAIPEGLPAVITLCLSLGTHRMAKKNVIVRKLKSVETLGCTSVICTDKTGTLTTNQMTVKSMLTFGGSLVNPLDTVDSMTELGMEDEIEESWPWETEDQVEGRAGIDGLETVAVLERSVAGVSFEPIGSIENFTELTMESSALQDLALVCSLCNEASVDFVDGKYTRVGEPTEAALKVLVEKLGAPSLIKSSDPVALADQCNSYWSSKFAKLAVLEFSRDRKCMSVLCRNVERNTNRLLVKGAAEVLLAKCNRVKLEDGSIIPIGTQARAKLNAKINELARRPLRCLAMAYKEGSELGELMDVVDEEGAAMSATLSDSNNFSALESNLILVGVCGIKDPARPEAASAILKCRDAGIRVMMITGDSKETAVAIAKEVNIIGPNADLTTCAFTGHDFFQLTEQTQLFLLRTGNKVFCRAEPLHKQKLISMLEQLGEITAMTGDGVNDSPALQQADIGIAMGITGTEVAKNAADMILADDNFATIVTAVEEGRSIYSNMQTFISFLVSCNIGEILTVFIATAMGIPEVLSPILLLWLNLVTDGPPATALGFNPSDPSIMKQPPRPRDEGILSRWLLIRYIVTGLYVSFATIGAFVWWYADKGVSLHQLCNWTQCSTWPDFTNRYIFSDLANPCDLFGVHKAVPQTMALSVLVVMEMLKALSAVSLDQSLLTVAPWKNPWLLVAVCVPTLMHLATLYAPLFSGIFGLVALTKREWKVVLSFAFPIVIVEEISKYIGRRRQHLKKLAHKTMQLENLKEFADGLRHGPMVPSPMF